MHCEYCWNSPERWGDCECCKERYLSSLPPTYENMRNMTEEERLSLPKAVVDVNFHIEGLVGDALYNKHYEEVFYAPESKNKSLWQRIKEWFR